MNLRNYFSVCFHLIGTFGKTGNPGPDTDVIALTQSQHCFSRSVALTSDSALFGSIEIRPDRSQHITHGGFRVRVMWELRWLELTVAEASPRNNPGDFLSPGQTEFTAQQMLGLFCLSSPFASQVLTKYQ
ncbi:hypothetical protein VZT92_020682 [Zoarces viviparus]|uniref:Uncharacterized protein n=1 Tax=Zoarces viviparus TaxID=48416 RepID=A0AAW1EFT2_ZOAVI